jgi:hypothetical protein
MLNTQVFVTIFEARRAAAEWQTDYNEFRPHSSLGKLTPREFAEQHKSTHPHNYPWPETALHANAESKIVAATVAAGNLALGFIPAFFQE